VVADALVVARDQCELHRGVEARFVDAHTGVALEHVTEQAPLDLTANRNGLRIHPAGASPIVQTRDQRHLQVRSDPAGEADFPARVLLARAIIAADPPSGPRNLRALYVEGDNDERAAVSRTLGLVDDPTYTRVAQEACRSNVKPVFEAIACDNPFPARHFGERPFCQMVLKTFLFGTRLSRVEGLRERTTAELFRMARDFADDLRATGRHVPDDVGELLALEGAA